MRTFRTDFDSVYERVNVRSAAKEALLSPKQFAVWCRSHLAQTPGMASWPARQWIGGFLEDVTNTRWIVDDINLDLLEIPRHQVLQLLIRHERTTSDPPLPLPTWAEAMTRENASGAEVLRFIDLVITPIALFPPLDKRRI